MSGPVHAEAWLDIHKGEFSEYVSDVASDIRHEYGSGHDEQCRLCGTVGCNVSTGQVELSGEYHEPDCPSCGGVVHMGRFTLKIQGHHSVRRSQTYVIHPCSGGCEKCPPPELSASTMVDRVEYLPNLATEIRERIHAHHIRYEPEITIPLCASCHESVHHDDGYGELEPVMKRKSWKSKRE